jgi:hypothetical protein
LSGHEDVFCIAAQSPDRSAIGKVKAALEASEGFKELCASPMFVEGPRCTRERLPEACRVDAAGDLEANLGAARSALAAVRKERHSAVTPAETPTSVVPRMKPASERTRDLPEVSSFEELRSYLGMTFTPEEWPHERGPMYWVTPEELCDIVETYAELILVEYREYSCGASESMCGVCLFEKDPPGSRPVEFVGLYPFSEAEDAARFGGDSFPAPEYSAALPRLAGIRGKYQFNFRKGDERRRAKPFAAAEGVSPGLLWNTISARLARFNAALEVEALVRDRRHAEESKMLVEETERTSRESKRRSYGQCLVCGLPLSTLDKLRGRDTHGICQPDEE